MVFQHKNVNLIIESNITYISTCLSNLKIFSENFRLQWPPKLEWELVDAIQNNSEIWDPEHPGYKDRCTKRIILNGIAQKFQEKYKDNSFDFSKYINKYS